MGQTNNQDADDLNQIDWLLFSSQQLIEQLDASIPVQIVKNDFGEKILIISQISQDNISKIPFLTNNDYNKNTLQLVDIFVYLENYREPINIPGLKEIVVKNIFKLSDVNAFLNGKNLHYQFANSNMKNSSSFNDFIDKLTNYTPFTARTTGKSKVYKIIMNPSSEKSI
jgi:hypothetical protein